MTVDELATNPERVGQIGQNIHYLSWDCYTTYCGRYYNGDFDSPKTTSTICKACTRAKRSWIKNFEKTKIHIAYMDGIYEPNSIIIWCGISKHLGLKMKYVRAPWRNREKTPMPEDAKYKKATCKTCLKYYRAHFKRNKFWKMQEQKLKQKETKNQQDKGELQ